MFHGIPYQPASRNGEPFPFPVDAARQLRSHSLAPDAASQAASWVIRDRRMFVLAQRLGCLGHYDGNPDEPTAA